MHQHTAYWDRGVRNVPDMTGAKHLLDARDLRAVFAALGVAVPLEGVVADVGCGTGRLAQLCANQSNYIGFDISPSMVDYCVDKGLSARLVNGPAQLTPFASLVTAISVFTHIDRAERQRYLPWFKVMAPRVVVDIIPGDGSGNVALWTAVQSEFELDCVAAGFRIVKSVDQAWDINPHRYYLLERE